MCSQDVGIYTNVQQITQVDKIIRKCMELWGALLAVFLYQHDIV